MLRTSGLPRWLKVMISQMVKGTNRTTFGDFQVEIKETLMSGMQWTSSANGVLNLCIMSFLTLKSRYPDATPEELIEKLDSFHGMFEGDDGLISCTRGELSQDLIRDMGLQLKMKYCDHFGDASFCGVVCDPVTLKVIYDPEKFLRKAFVLPPKLQHASTKTLTAYLRCKMLSYYHLFGDAPIVGPISKYICDQTRSVDVSHVIQHLDYHDRERLNRIGMSTLRASARSVKEPGIEVRTHCERVFSNWTVGLQYDAEKSYRDFQIVDTSSLLSLEDLNHLEYYVLDAELAIHRPELRRYFDDEWVSKVVSDGWNTARKRAKPKLIRCTITD
jgi:hypothetical protein